MYRKSSKIFTSLSSYQATLIDPQYLPSTIFEFAKLKSAHTQCRRASAFDLVSSVKMDPNPKDQPLLSYILHAQNHHPNNPDAAVHLQSDPNLHLRFPHLTNPDVVVSMTRSVSDVIRTRSLLRALGDRPTSTAIDTAKAMISSAESSSSSVIEDGEVQVYRAVLRLDQMHRDYGEKLGEAEEGLLEAYRAAVEELGLERREGDGGGGGGEDDDVGEEVIQVLEKAANGERIEKVEIMGCRLRVLPERFGKVQGLVKLDLSENLLQVLPDSIDELSELEVLNVSFNQLESLPESIGMLLKLKILNVSKNQLIYLPESITGCSNLEELDGSYNQLKSLPETIGYGLPNLKSLKIYYNKLRLLPSSLCQLESLLLLDVRMNQLHHLPSQIGRLTNIETLNVSGNFNDLHEIPQSICDLTNLKDLDLSNNQIRSLPDSFHQLKSLSVLKLDGNPLVVPPVEVAQSGAQQVKDYMIRRWIQMVDEDHRRRVIEARKLARANSSGGWAEWSASLLTKIVYGASQIPGSFSGYIGINDQANTDRFLDQEF